MQNIGGENAGDAFYRYKMPKLIAKVCVSRACNGSAARWWWLLLSARDSGRSRAASHTIMHAPSPCMPCCHAAMQIEGRGNGIKTNVVNNVDIAKALERPPECELLWLCGCGVWSKGGL
jgi:hypothetical protein